MSGHNAALTLPPGDRDDADELSGLATPLPAPAPGAGRKPIARAGRELEVARLRGMLAEAFEEYERFALAYAQGALPAQEAPIWQLALALKGIEGLTLHLAHEIAADLRAERARRNRRLPIGGQA